MQLPLDSQDAEHLLVTNARTTIERVLSRYFGSNALTEQDAEDIAATVNLRLIEKMRRVAASLDEPLQNIDGYVAAITYNAVNDHLRSRYPENTRLRNRLRYVLTHDERLSLWSAPEGLACGLSDSPQATIAATVMLDSGRITSAMRDDEHPADAVCAILTAQRAPVAFDALANFVAALWNVVDASPVELSRMPPPSQPVTADAVETRQFLRVLWSEIRQLRPMQRKALLLNLREQQNADAVSTLILGGIATFAELAAALEMSTAELAAIWNELPFDDARIAAMLNVTRQQVINLRKSARARLNRRTR